MEAEAKATATTGHGTDGGRKHVHPGEGGGVVEEAGAGGSGWRERTAALETHRAPSQVRVRG